MRHLVQVDIVISEPMGFALIHERMLESYIVARQKFMRPGGKMFPSTGTIYAAPFTDHGACSGSSGSVAVPRIAQWLTPPPPLPPPLQCCGRSK
jgi:hypothetical protein